MLVRYSDWKRPTDAAYAFALRAEGSSQADGFLAAVPEAGVRSDIREVARQVLGEEGAARFEARVDRWSGPEDVVGPEGVQPWVGQQLSFEEAPWRPRLTLAEVEQVLAGTVRVMRRASGQVDYVLRDHHMLDVVLYHYRTTGTLPRALFHADRHSDWCRDNYLEARRPQQAATWWKLLEGLKRPDTGASVLGEGDVFFTTAQATRNGRMSGKDIGVATLIPSSLSVDGLGWEHVMAQSGAAEADWASLDLDFFQPAPQLALSKGLLRDARFAALMEGARVRVFVLSPQFLNGGDRLEKWEVQGSLHSALRLLNLLRQK